MIESERRSSWITLFIAYPIGVDRRCDSNKGDPQLCLGRGGVNVYLRDCLSECCFCLIIVHLVLKTANSWSIYPRDLQRNHALATDGLGQDRLN